MAQILALIVQRNAICGINHHIRLVLKLNRKLKTTLQPLDLIAQKNSITNNSHRIRLV